MKWDVLIIVLLVKVHAWRIGLSKYWCAPISLKPSWSCSRAWIYFLRPSNTVFSVVRLIMWLLRTNKSKILLWRRKYIQTYSGTMYSYSLWRRKLIQALKPLNGRLKWHLCALVFCTGRFLHASTIPKKTMVLIRRWLNLIFIFILPLLNFTSFFWNLLVTNFVFVKGPQ